MDNPFSHYNLYMENRPKRRMPTNILNWISRYSIYVNGKGIEHKLIGWRTALAHARRHANDLFEPNKVVEILNIWTGEIVTYEEAEQRAAAYKKSTKLSQ